MDIGHSGLGKGLSLRFYALLGAVAVLLAVSFGPTVTSASAGAMQRLPGCTLNELPANDDSSTAEVPLGFTANFQGTNYTGVFVNNNGNVTFGSSLFLFTPEPFGSLGKAIIAPFWADVDTRMGTVVKYGTTTYPPTGFKAFCVEWDGVGYFASHADKLNKFELILVSRPDRGPGDFDIIFNYDGIQWETGDASGGVNGLGGTAPRIGFGLQGGGSEELSGSGTNGAFLDNGPAALVAGGENNLGIAGRYVFPVVGGQAQGEPGLHGLVTSHNAALIGAAVQACQEGTNNCYTAQTDGQGKYHFLNLPTGLYSVTVNPPSGDAIDLPTTVGPAQVTGTAPVNLDVVMSTLTPPPSGWVIGGVGSFGKGQPILDWKASTPIQVNGCPGASPATFEVVVPANSSSGKPRTIATGSLGEGPSGTYKGTIPPLYPFHGFAQIKVTLKCPAPSPPQIGSFDIYVDPSGHVLDTTGAAVAGATVTLQRAPAAAGPFAAVASGSAIMAPNNRNNPSTTDSAGRFGWDVLAGFYTVTASKTGCINPSNPAIASVSTGVLTVPPPVTDLKLVLNCDPLTGLTAVPQRDGSIKVSFQSTGAGAVKATGTTTVKVRVTVVKKGKHGKKIRKKVTKLRVVAYASGHSSDAGAQIVTFTIVPSGKAKALLKQHKSLRVPVTVVFTPSPATTPTTKAVQVTVRYVVPKKHKKQKHKKQKHKKH